MGFDYEEGLSFQFGIWEVEGEIGLGWGFVGSFFVRIIGLLCITVLMFTLKV